VPRRPGGARRSRRNGTAQKAPTLLLVFACRARLTADRAVTARPPVRASSMATARKIRLSVKAPTGSRDRTQAVRYAYTHGYANPARS
jgi:hypothetical protein